MELLERAEELADLDELLTASAAGGHVAVISGEAGAGKSALAAAFASRAGARARMLWGACDPLLTPRALGPLHDIAQQVGGPLRESIAGGRRDDVFDALLTALDGPRQQARPVVVIEDLHWADEATLDMLAFLGRRLSRCRVLLVLTYRDDEVGPDHQLRTVLAGLPRDPVRRLSLPPLTAGAVAELARRAGRAATDVFEVTGGNPLLVTEVLAGSAEGVPATVRDLVLSRLSAMSPAAREAAGLVSVVPSQAEAALLGARVVAVDECLANGVLVATADSLAFRHELLRRAVEESLSPVRRAALHAEVLAALATRPAVDPARLVHHAHHAGDAEAVLRWAPVAAARASDVRAYRQAAAHYATALPFAAGVGAPELAGLLEAYSLAAYHGGLTPEALDARQRALALRALGGDVERIGDDLRWVSRLSWWNGRPDDARVAGLRAVAVLETIPPGRHLAAAYSHLSGLHMLGDEDAEAILWGERALTLARRLGDAETEVNSLINIASARLMRGYPAGRTELIEAHETAVAAGVDDQAGRALVNLGSMAVDWADYRTAEDVLDRVLPFTIARDLDGYTRHMLGHRARLRLARGDWRAARADADQALTGPEQPGACLLPALAVRGVIRSRRGEAGATADLELAAERGHRTGELQFVAPAAIALAEHLWLAGDPDRAAAEAKRGLELAEAKEQPWFVGELAYWLWRCGQLGEAPAMAARPYRLLIGGDWRGAASEWAALGCPYPRALALACGDGDATAEALRVLDGFGAVVPARRLRAELRERGLRVPRGPRASTAADPTGLTARQLEVLALIADGLSNAQIAERLTVSAKTVDHHVSAVLGKLGVATRGLAAAAARRDGLLT